MTTKWTDELIESELKKCIDALHIKRMPTATELQSLGRNDLHCKVSRTKKYRGWAEYLGLELKESETTKGQRYEEHIVAAIENYSNHFRVKRMTTKHPFDLLINDCVKVDVKVGKAHRHFDGCRAHTFNLSKKYATCDFYICVALDENEEIESYFIIPAKFTQLVTLNIGTESKYNKFKDAWVLLLQMVYALESFYGDIT